jgi:hypothetical protein
MTVIAGDDIIFSAPSRTSAHPILIGLTRTPPAEHIAAQQIIGAKLYTLRLLRDGWLGAGSVAPKQGAFAHYLEFLSALGNDVTLDAEAVATGDGTLEVEWDTDDGERLIEFSERGAWLLDTTAQQNIERTVEPFDVEQARDFFLGNAI